MRVFFIWFVHLVPCIFRKYDYNRVVQIKLYFCSFNSELEHFVEELKKDSPAKIITLKDVEDGAFLLRQVGEAVATLKGLFSSLSLTVLSLIIRSDISLSLDLELYLLLQKKKNDAAGVSYMASGWC